MAFTTIPSSLIAVAKSIKAEIFSLVKQDLDDLDIRVQNIESESGKVSVFNTKILSASTFTTLSEIDMVVAERAFNLIEAKVILFVKGSASGTLEIDIKKGTTGDSSLHTTVFSTKPSLVMASSSSYDESTNAVFSSAAISQGDYISLHITSMPTGLYQLGVLVYGEV
jgi:hypothetical protein